MRARGLRLVAWMAGLAAAVATSAVAAVQPDPGNAAARATGLALLAESPGPLALFDQPARLAPTTPARVAMAAARARPFGLDALARTRIAASFARRAFAGALGLEGYGPPGARRTRLLAGAAWRRADAHRGLELGAAWQEVRLESGSRSVRAGALDAGGVLARGSFTAAFAARALASGGATRARPDPDWTLEASVDLGLARLHGVLTHDLVGTRPGGGIAFAVGPCVLRAGAYGAPWGGALGVELATGGARGARFAAARIQHPELGPSDAWDAEVAW